MEPARFYARLGVLICAVGLFLVLTPLEVLGAFLAVFGVIIWSLSWGLSRVDRRPALVALVGLVLSALGIVWIVWYASRYIWGSCAGVGLCFSSGPLTVDPAFWLGLGVAAPGVVLVVASSYAWWNGRRKDSLLRGFSKTSR
jgi:hypothetical protein